MPSKLRKAIGAVKDQTSISLAKVSNNASNLDIAILKATSHEEFPVEERYVTEVLQLISSDKLYASSCAQAIARRIGKTRNWIVALKSLMLVLQIFQDGDPYFPREVLHAMKRGAKILNLTSFRDDSNSSPWDYTAFVRTFSLYLDERLDCFLTGKLQRRFAFRENEISHRRSRRSNDPVRDMKPAMLLDRISYWQRLLDRAIATRPTGAAKTNRLVQISLYAIVRESFDLYRDISDGLALLLDSFFHLQYQSCVNAFQACVKASKQFEELSVFYELCKSIGVGRTSEYPSVQKISDELVETLQEFLKDQASFPANGRSPSPLLLLPAPPSTSKDPSSSSERYESCTQSEISEPTERFSFGSQQTSLEDLMSVTEAGMSPSVSFDLEASSDQFDKRSQQEDFISVHDTCSTSTQSIAGDQGISPSISLVSFDDWPQQELKQEREDEQKSSRPSGSVMAPTDNWELVLAEMTTQSTQPSPAGDNTFNPTFPDNFNDQTSLPLHYNNPFLLDTTEITATPTAAIVAATNVQTVLPGIDDLFSTEPTFQATPTFCAQNPIETTGATQNENDLFASSSTLAVDDQNVLHEQQLWLQNQQKIIARNIS